MNDFKKVTMLGLGYIGLPTAALLAKYNIKVHGVDINENVVNTINKGQIHIRMSSAICHGSISWRPNYVTSGARSTETDSSLSERR